MRHIILILLTTLISSCTFASSINKISLGMTKDQVISTLGNPYSISAQGPAEYLKYQFYTPGTYLLDEYYVRIVDGKVESYGQFGDFDSRNTPEQKVIIDINKKDI